MKTKATKTYREWEERSQVPECIPVVLFDRKVCILRWRKS
jgi:hypothetical protein